MAAEVVAARAVEAGRAAPQVIVANKNLVLSDVNWRYVGIPEGRGFSPAVSAPHPAFGHPLPRMGRGAGGEGVASSGGVKTPPFPGRNRNDAYFRH